jgi:hypothetical protein
MGVLQFGVSVLASRRLVRLITEDKILEDARIEAFARWPPEDHKLSYLMSCKKCLSVWTAFAATSGLVPKTLVDTLAVSEVTILLMKGLSRWDSSNE